MDDGGQRMIKLLYKPAGMLASMAGGMLASAIFAVVRALVERLAAAGTRSLTGVWPGADSGTRTEETA